MKKTTPPLQTVTVHDEDLAQRCARGRVVVIDDDKDVLDALCALIHMAGYACESYSSGLTYLQVLSYNQPCFPGPCCILCDVKMPELSGLELQQRLARLDNNTPLLVMSGSSGVSEAVTAFRQGVLDFFTKPVDADTLLAGIDKALRLSTERQQHGQHRRLLAARVATLSQRERDVARRVVQGQTNPAIAQALGIALRTVKLHRQHAMEKLAAGSLAELVRLADEVGL